MLRNEKVSDVFLAFIGSSSLIINACFSGLFASSENFEILMSCGLSKLIIYLFEQKFNHKEIKKDDTNQLISSFYQIIDNIPSGILFWTKHRVVKANKFWFKMQKKLSHFYRKADSDKNLYRYGNSSKEDDENDQAYEALKHFKWAKSNQISLQDIVKHIVGKEDSLLVNPLQDFFKVFNSSFVEELKDANDVRDEITKDFTRNTAHLQEVTVVCNLFNPPKEYNAYIYLILSEEESKEKPHSSRPK